MFSLYILGGLLEPAIGRLRFGLIYFMSLLAGSFGALLLEPSGLTVGASGRHLRLDGRRGGGDARPRPEPDGERPRYLDRAQPLFTFTIPNISIGAHVGGLIGGTVAALLLFDVRERMRLPELAGTALCVALAVVAVAASVVVSATPG